MESSTYQNCSGSKSATYKRLFTKLIANTKSIGDNRSPCCIPAARSNGSPTTVLPTRMHYKPPRNLAIHRTTSNGTHISTKPAYTNSCIVLSYTFSTSAPKNHLSVPHCIFSIRNHLAT